LKTIFIGVINMKASQPYWDFKDVENGAESDQEAKRDASEVHEGPLP
jgi:hypothetical protein